MSNNNCTEPQDIVDFNQQSIKNIARAISLNRTQSSLILVCCNYLDPEQQNQIFEEVKNQSKVKIQEICLTSEADSLDAEIARAMQNRDSHALIVFGISKISCLNEILQKINMQRDKISSEFSFPIVLWINNDVLVKLREAPDLDNFSRILITLNSPLSVLINCIEECAKDILENILEDGAGILWQQNKDTTLDECKDFLHISQLKPAKRDLQEQNINLTPEVEASLKFLLGHSPELTPDQREQHYQNSLQLWQEIDNWQYKGCVLYCMGVLAMTYAMQNPAERNVYFGEAKKYFDDCVTTFEKAKPPDLVLVSKFINAQAEGCKRVKKWDELQEVADRALKLHQKSGNKVREARANGFLAEVAIHNSKWREAKKYAKKACQILEDSNNLDNLSSEQKAWQNSCNYGWYLLSLAQAQKNLGKLEKAITNLEIAKRETKSKYDPKLYINILNELQKCYYKNYQYLDAFKIKQKRQEVEQQFGFKAFVGAGQLQFRKSVNNPAYLTSATGGQEINISGRDRESKLLKEWIQDIYHKLIVIYGPSGGGKSSFLRGFIYALEPVKIERRSLRIVVQNSYQNWRQQLYKKLGNNLLQQNKETSLAEVRNNDIFQVLSKIKDQNLYTILIFDDIKNLFSSNKELSTRKEFYSFLKELLQKPYVKILFLLREEYLHYLLECNRQANLRVIRDNLLYVGNFSPNEAEQVIKSLTNSTAFQLEEALIKKVVSDLSKESGEVRPLELQLVGYQLQELQEKNKNITALQGYEREGGKKKLIESYIEEVVKDCGLSENQKVAWLVLYLLTGESPDNRPHRTKTELLKTLQELKFTDLNYSQLDVVLNILVGSKLVVKQPEAIKQPEADIERYHLSHDYFISIIQNIVPRNYYQEVTTLDAQKQTKRELKQIIQLQKLYSESQFLIRDHEQLKALSTTVKLGNQLQKAEFDSKEISKLKDQTKHQLRHLVCDIQESNRLEKHTSDVYRINFSPDGKFIASASWDKTIIIWHSDGTIFKILREHEKAVNSVKFNPDGTILASASADGTVKLWNWKEGKRICTFPTPKDWLWYVTFSPDGQIVASAGGDGKILLWNLKGDIVNTLEGHTARVYCVRFSSDGQLLVSSSEDHQIIIWKRHGNNDYQYLKDIKCGSDFHSVAINPVAINPDDETIAAGGWDKVITIWNLDREPIKTLKGHSDCVNSVQFSPDGNFLASASNDKTIKLWHVKYGTCLKTFRGHKDWVNDISIRRYQQQIIIASASDDNTVRIWKYQPTLEKSFQGNEGHSRKVSSAIFSPNGQIIASASWDRTIKLWNLDGTLKKTLQDPTLEKSESHKDWVWEANFSPDGKFIASASGDETVKIWSIIDGELKQKPLTGHDSCVHSVSFSPDSQLLASGGDDIRLWRKNTDGTWKHHQVLAKKHEDTIWQVRFHESPHGILLASASADKTVKLWQEDPDSGQFKLFKNLEKHTEWVNGISFSPDGTMLASAGNDNEPAIIIWSLEPGKIGKLLHPIHPITGHDARIYSVDFSRDGQMLASASADRTIKIWSLDGTLLKTLEGHEAWVNSVNFSPVDPRMLVSASSDHTVKLWRLPPIPLLDPNQSELDQLLERGEKWLQDYRNAKRQNDLG